MEFVPRKSLKISMEDSFLPQAKTPSSCRCRICLKILRNVGAFWNEAYTNPVHCPQWTCLVQFQLMQAKSRYKLSDAKLKMYRSGHFTYGMRMYYQNYLTDIGRGIIDIIIIKSLQDFHDQINPIIGALLEERENEKRRKDDQTNQEGTLGNNQPAQQ